MKKIVDGNYACSLASYDFTEVAGIYPITPSSQMAEQIDEWSNQGKKNMFEDQVKVIQMQSEAGAAGMLHGVLSAGLLGTTYTASQGLLLMIPNIYKMVGEMLPGVIHVSARALSTHALSIFGDHQDIYAVRQTGITMLASSSVQDAYYLGLIAHLTAIKTSLPVLHFFDGFRTSHELTDINILKKDDYLGLVDENALANFRAKALHPNKAITKGTAQNDDIYFQSVEARNKYHQKVVEVVCEYMAKINKLANTNYQPFSYYGSENASKVIVAMGSVAQTIKETIDATDSDYGLVEVHLYRPFAVEKFLEVLPKTVKKIAVLDRTKEPGSFEPLYLDVVAALKNKAIEIVGGRYGLSSKNVPPSDIMAVFKMLESDNLKNPFTIGINDDVTNLSLVPIDFKINNSLEFAIYGYGSDGMVSAAKSIIKIIGNLDRHVQGYFQYDSKKSGGVTLSHLRFSKKPILASYYVENPSLVVVTKESYFKQYDILKNIANNGVLLINTSCETFDFFSENDHKIIANRSIKVYGIDANGIAQKHHIAGKISIIMAMAIFSVTKIIKLEYANQKLCEMIDNIFAKKGEEIVLANKNALADVNNNIKSLKLGRKNNYQKSNDLVAVINRRDGDSLPVSAFDPSGTFAGGTTKTEKREIANEVPKWVSDNCIQCGLCSFVCPHAVIRLFHLNNDEIEKSPTAVKNRVTKVVEKNIDDHAFCIGISVKDCTGCQLCVNKCPGKGGQKALINSHLNEEVNNNEQVIADYLFNNISDKGLINDTIIKGTQLKKPRFEYSGACAGCGQTPYLKLLTQLFGDQLVIANATGCSSIYGGTAPSTPYDIPWASSLFEDNAEYAYGMEVAYQSARNRLTKIMQKSNDDNKVLYQEWLDNQTDPLITKKIYEKINYDLAPKELIDLKDYIPARTVWAIGGDGWAYDIGFSGIDHVLASLDNVNMLVLDTQVYSNTGGQTSKASTTGSIASFASMGKEGYRKDLAKIALTYPNVYVAQVSLGANGMQLIKALKEAAEHNGPSLVIAYTPCIAHGIEGGMANSLVNQELAVKSGFFPIFRANTKLDSFTLDSPKVDFDLYKQFLQQQKRFSMLKTINPAKSEELLAKNKEQATKTFHYYQKIKVEVDINKQT